MSKYLQADIVAMKVARFYSNETGKPFIAVAGDHGDYDVAAVDQTMRIEIKTETTPTRTGNLAIEFWNTSLFRASGILETKATHWLHIIPEENAVVGYEMDIDVLRKLAIEHGVVKGNGCNSLFKLIPVGIIKQHALRRIDFSRIVELGGVHA